MKCSSNQSQRVAITAWQDQLCEKVHFKFVTKGFALFSVVEAQEGPKIYME
jgi:hypothetical protein